MLNRIFLRIAIFCLSCVKYWEAENADWEFAQNYMGRFGLAGLVKFGRIYSVLDDLAKEKYADEIADFSLNARNN